MEALCANKKPSDVAFNDPRLSYQAVKASDGNYLVSDDP